MWWNTKLVLGGEADNLERLLARADHLLRDGWSRDYEAEARARQRGERNPRLYCYRCTSRGDRPAAAFCVRGNSGSKWLVQEVLPGERIQLTDAEARAVLEEFQREFLAPGAHELGAETEVLQPRRALEDYLSFGALEAVRAFADSPNRGQLQPSDRRLWNAFIAQVHLNDDFFELAVLEDWLQMNGWPDDVRRQLIDEYRLGQTLLLAYDEEVARR